LLSYALDYAVGGLNAYAFHLSSNLCAGVVAGFVYLVALALTQQRITAVVTAFLFVVHPAHVEAVAWISSRKDLVAAAFVLPCVLTYLKYRRRGAIGWYIVSLLLFFFALLGKLSVAAFPAVLVVIDLVLEKRPLRRSVIDKVPFLVPAVMVAVAVQHAQPSTGLQPDPAVNARAFFQSLWLLTGAGKLCYLSCTSCVRKRFVPIDWARYSGWLVRTTVASTQTLSCCDCFDLLDPIYLSSNTGSAIQLSGS
jgi:uncharacterized membrane protein (UPF0136 family)